MNHRPLVGGFSAAAYEAARAHHYAAQQAKAIEKTKRTLRIFCLSASRGHSTFTLSNTTVVKMARTGLNSDVAVDAIVVIDIWFYCTKRMKRCNDRADRFIEKV